MIKLSVSNAVFDFNGTKICLPNIHEEFAEPAGSDKPSLLIIKGRIGCGKTLLLKTLGGAVAPNSGSITLTDNNGSLKGWFVHSQAEFNFITGIVSDELDFAGVNKAPFTEYLGRNVNEVSGGELKSLSVRMAVEAATGAVFLDEPLDMLDDAESEHMAAYICDNACRKPIIIATHDDHFDKYTDNIVRIDRGDDVPPVIPAKSININDKAGLSAHRLSVHVDGRTFPEITFENMHGEILCLYGRNGSGKTLFTRTVAGIGRYKYSGSYKWSETAAKRGICLQFPEQMAYQETISEEIADCAGKDSTDKVLDILGWHDRRENSPFSLSDGEKRTMYIISMLVRGKACLFDEPFAGLDQRTANFIVESFYKARSEGASIIYTANRLRDTVYADRTTKI